MRTRKWRYRLHGTFFVISKEELGQYIYNTRANVLALVHYGFSREEVYYMPLSEMMDYIKILNDMKEEFPAEIPEISEEKKEAIEAMENVKMAGNTL